MAVFRRNLNSWRRAARLATIVMVFTAAWVVVTRAQTAQTPSALFQQATLTGSGNTINATHIPVVTASGVTVYVNLAMQFNADANGNLTLSSGFPQVTPFPALLTSGFVAGRYVGPSAILAGKTNVTVSGPGVTDGGATQWSLSAAAGADVSTFPSSATWYVGPIANNPLAARISKAGITSTALSYGVGSSQFGNVNSTFAWYPNTLIGVSQIGNTITIASFTSSGNVDSNIPRDQITYTLVP
jgi:hypothetical protein